MTIKLSILQDSRQMVKKKWGSEMDLELAQTEDDIALNPDLFSFQCLKYFHVHVVPG